MTATNVESLMPLEGDIEQALLNVDAAKMAPAKRLLAISLTAFIDGDCHSSSDNTA